jgi:hypothetical protein
VRRGSTVRRLFVRDISGSFNWARPTVRASARRPRRDAIDKYDLSNCRRSHYWGLSHDAAPVSECGISPHSADVYMPEGANARASVRRGMPGPMHIRDWPIAKTIVVPSDTTSGLSLEYVLI